MSLKGGQSVGDSRLKVLGRFLLRHETAVLALVLFPLLASNLNADPDLFARLAVGQLFFELGRMPLADPFSFGEIKPVWIDHEWLSGLVFYSIFSRFSDGGLIILKFLSFLAVLIFSVLSGRMFSAKKNMTGLFIKCVIIFDTLFVWASTVRSHIFTMFFISLYLLVFVSYHKKGKLTAFLSLPLCMLVWSNLHGGFVVGLGMHILFILTAVRERYLGHFTVLALSVLATAINPYGFIPYWSFILEALTMPRPSIAEWQSIKPGAELVIPLLVLLSGLFLLFKKQAHLFRWLFFLVGACFAFRHERHLGIFYLIALSLVDWHAAGSGEGFKTLNRALVLTFLGFLTYGITNAAVYILNFGSLQLDRSKYPVDELNWLKHSEPGGNLLVDFNNGSYAIWALYPKFRVSMDGRYEEVYTQARLDLVSTALNCKHSGQSAALQSIAPDYIIAGSDKQCFSGFQEIHSSSNYRIFKKSVESGA